MAAKAEVSKETPDRAEIESLLANWDFPGPLTDFSILFGGYSGTSLKVVGADGSKFVLKINHGYDIDAVEAQARVAVYARAKGFSGACTAYALRGKPATFAVARPSDGTPCCLLSWVDGVAADKVIAAVCHKDFNRSNFFCVIDASGRPTSHRSLKQLSRKTSID
jgi:hypothetical protein